MKYFIALSSLIALSFLSSCSSDQTISDIPPVSHESGIQVVGVMKETSIPESAGTGMQETYSVSGVTK